MLLQRAEAPLKTCGCKAADEVNRRGVWSSRWDSKTCFFFFFVLGEPLLSGSSVRSGCKDTKRCRRNYLNVPPPSISLLACILFFCQSPFVDNAQTDGLLKQSNQVELSFLQMLPFWCLTLPGASRTYETQLWDRQEKREGGYKKQLWKGKLCGTHLGLEEF